MNLLAAVILAQVGGGSVLNANGTPITRIVCDGGIACVRRGNTVYLSGGTSGDGGGVADGIGAPQDGGYLTLTAGSTGSTNEKVLTAGSNISITTVGSVATIAMSGTLHQPGPTNRTVQFNNDGGFGGAAGLKIDNAGWPVVGSLWPTSATPSAPDAGVLLTSAVHANESFLAWRGASGLTSLAQASLWDTSTSFTTFQLASAQKTDVGWATTAVTAGGVVLPTMDTTNYGGAFRRATYASNTANGQGGVYVSSLHTYFNNASSGLGGFFCSLIWNVTSVNTVGSGNFGLQAAAITPPSTQQPSTMTNVLQAEFNAIPTIAPFTSNETVLKLCARGSGAGTCTTCGYASVGGPYQLNISAKPGVNGFYMELFSLADRTLAPCTHFASGSTVDIPGPTITLAPMMFMRNMTNTNPVPGIGLVSFDAYSMYCQASY